MKWHRATTARIAKIVFPSCLFLAALAGVSFGGRQVYAAAPPFQTNLQLYDQDADILSLQHLLDEEGFVVAQSGAGSLGNETPLFGLHTYNALIAFQSAHGLPATGYFGPLTRGLMNSDASTSSFTTLTSVASSAPTTTSATATTTAPLSEPLPGYAPGQIIFIGGSSAVAAPAAPADTTPPSVSVTAPTDGATVSGTSVILASTASDNIGIAGVQFRISGNNIGSAIISAPYTSTWDSTSVADGSYRVAAVAHDAAGNYATSSVVSITVDNTPPIRSGGSPTGVLAFGTSSTTLSVNTNEAATCRYSSTPGTAYASGTSFVSTGGTSHSTTIGSLANNSSYIYYVRCQDAFGNTNTDDFTISFSVADATSPSVSLTAPLVGNTVSGTSVALSATASDSIAVSSVQFKVDGANIGSAIGSAPYQTTWNSTGVTDGSHTLYAVALNSSGKLATSSASITVDNTPPVISTISSGSPGATSATITWSTNEPATSEVDYGTSNAYGTASTSSNLVSFHSIHLTGLTATSTYHYQVQSTDAAGNLATSSDQTFFTDPQPIQVPSGFGWTPSFNIYRSTSGVYSTDFNINSFVPTVTKTYYVDVVNGNNANSGTSVSPLLNLSTCLAKTDVDQCIIKQSGTQAANGAYIMWGNRGWAGTTPTRSVSVIVAGGGRAISVKSNLPTWTLTSGDTHTYQTALVGTVPGPPTDLSAVDSNGDFVQPTVVASVAAVETTPNSYFYNGTSTVYVHPSNGRSLVGDLYMTLPAQGNNGAFNTASALTLWVSNIDFIGGSPFAATQPSAPSGTAPSIYLLNDSFQGSDTAVDGLEVLGKYNVFVQQSRSSKNYDDGFGYHQANSVSPNVFEYDNSTGFNGNSNSSDQADSAHDNAMVVTLNPTLAGAANQTIKDIGSAERWMLGGSIAAPVETDAGGPTISVTNSAQMWLDGTTVSPAGTNTLDLETPAILRYRNVDLSGLTKSSGGGSLLTY